MTYRIAIFFVLLLFCSTSDAQPGDPHNEIRLMYFMNIQDSINRYPDNLFYKWVRADLLFDPHFDLYTKSSNSIDGYLNDYYDYHLDSVHAVVAQPCKMCPNRRVKIENPNKQISNYLKNNYGIIESDLSALIHSDFAFEEGFIQGIAQFTRAANKASFLYKRGQLYYLTGRKELALLDFKRALEHGPSEHVRQEIFISLSAYYYNREDSKQSENDSLALFYLDQIVPDDMLAMGPPYTWQMYDREKMMLLERMGEIDRLIAYQRNKVTYYFDMSFSHVAERRQDENPSYNETYNLELAQAELSTLFELIKKHDNSADEEILWESFKSIAPQ